MPKVELLLIRGIPGSGKSTLAKTMLETHNHVESDQFFTNKQGQYKFVKEKLVIVHKLCQLHTKASLREGNNTVVSNTFSEMWEIDPYIKIAIELKCKIKIITQKKNYGSIHDVPLSSMKRFKKRLKKITNKDVKTRKQELKYK